MEQCGEDFWEARLKKETKMIKERLDEAWHSDKMTNAVFRIVQDVVE